MNTTLRMGFIALSLLAASGCSSSSSVQTPWAPATEDRESVEIAAKALCGCQVSGSGTFTNTVAGPEQGDTIEYAISASQKRTTSTSNVQGTTTFTNLDTGETTRVRWSFIGCDQDNANLNKQSKSVLQNFMSATESTGAIDYREGPFLTPVYAGTASGTLSVEDLGQNCD